MGPLLAVARRARRADAHARPAHRHVRGGPLRRCGRRGDAATCSAGWSGRWASGIGWDRLILDPGLGFAKRPEHSFAVLAATSRLAALGRPLLVGPSRKSFLTAATGPLPAADRDWATAAAVTAAVLGRRAHRPGASRRRSGAGRPRRRRHPPRLRVGFAGGRRPAIRSAYPLDGLAFRPAAATRRHLVGPSRHRDRVGHRVRAAQAHSRDPRGADGDRHRRGRRAVLHVAGPPARNPQLADPQHRWLHRLRGHRADAGGHPPGAGAPGPRAHLPALRSARRATTRRSKNSWWRPAPWRRSAPAPSSWWNGTSGCATSSRAASRSMPG